MSAPATAVPPPPEVAVSTTGLDAGSCEPVAPCRTISYAIRQVAHGGTVRIAAGWYAENVTVPGDLAVNLVGAGMDATVLNGRQSGTVVTADGAGALGLADLTIVNGSGTDLSSGGGVTAYGPLTVRRVRLWHNAGDLGGGIAAFAGGDISESIIAGNTARTGGGGIFTQYGALAVRASTVSDNRVAAPGSLGGGVYAILGWLRIEDSTVVGNAVGGTGSGIATVHASLKLRHVTVAGHRTASPAVVTIGDPGGLAHDIIGSLFADNSGGDCALAYPPAVDPADQNVSADGSCGRQVPDPLIDLRPLDLDSGGTPTRALGLASTIRGGIHRADPLCDGVDQRGQPRRNGLSGGCDPGAHQSAPVPFNLLPPVVSLLSYAWEEYQVSPGNWFGGRNLVYRYQWERCTHAGECGPIAGATSTVYRVVPADSGHRLRARVTVTSPVGISQPAYSGLTDGIPWG
nr:hypothetical protein [Micromonospora sp. DSM 115978]